MKLIIDIGEEVLNKLSEAELGSNVIEDVLEAVENGIIFPKGHERKFEEIMVEYPPAELCTYPEYRGKPYFSIKYEEGGKYIIGFGTYKPEVFSRYLLEYFIAPTIIEADKAERSE